jgi:cob(I)alamin adenosyltransferase
MPKFYTATGDDGYTGLLKEGRVPKYDPILEAVGALDEANAALGLARSVCVGDQSGEILLAVQRDLYHMMSEISASPDNASRFYHIDSDRVAWLEEKIENLNTQVKIPGEFIVPGDSNSGAVLDLARTIIRRAERRLVLLAHQHVVENRELLRYLNRLSSLCFVIELYENQSNGNPSPTLASGS